MAIILNRTTTFATNGTVTAAGLHNLIDDTAIYSGLITTQTNLASVGTGDKLLIAQASGGDTASPFSTTVLNLFDDALTGGTYTSLNLSENLTYGTATGNRTVSTSATITTGTIPNLTSSTANITLGTIPTLTTGTTTSTAANITNLSSTTSTFLGAITASTNTINVGSGQIYKDASGNVGIGTTSNTANSKLEVYGNSAAAHVGIRANNAAADGYGTLWLSNNGSNDGLIRGGASAASFTNQLAIITSGTTPVTIATNNTERLRIASAGQIGIGGANYGTSGQVLTSAGASSAPSWATSPAGLRNRIINGDMRIDQRNAGSAVTVGTGTVGYTLDRFFAYQNSPSTLVQASRNTSAPSGFQNSIKLGRNGSGVAGLVVFGQALETSNCLDAQGGTVTLSFYAKAGANFSAASSQIGVTLYSGTGTDQSALSMVTSAWTGTATPISSTAILTTSWQRFTFTSTSLGASVSQLGMTLNWTNVGVAGADDNVYITGVQLETGSNATDFERRPIGMELALCQRYYIRYSGDSARFYGGRTESAALGIASWAFPVEMRATPTVASGTIGNISINDGSVSAAATALSTQYSTSKLFAQSLSCGAVTSLRPIFISFSSGSYLDASIEL